MVRYFVLSFVLILFLSTNVEASTLFGRVIEINDGDVITVFNLNRPVRIKLLAVDAPEAGQAFGDVAKKHLSTLVYDKSVLVEYWSIAADGSLVGRVMLNTTDIGAQMIRDGAAWFDASNQERLSAADREVYQQSEQAARSERRGLWQADSPIAPWEFVRAQALRQNPRTSLNSVLPAAKTKPDRPTPELTSLTLRVGRMAPPATSATPAPPATPAMNESEYAWATNSEPKSWKQFKPEGENFSALVPDEGRQVKIPVPFGDQMVDVNVYMARDNSVIYSLMWITGPSYGESDWSAIQGTVRGFLKGVAEGFQRSGGGPFACELESERRISVNGYSGGDFELPTCTVPGKVRALTKVGAGQRQMYVAATFYMQEDANVSRFLRSFTAGTPSPQKSRSTKR